MKNKAKLINYYYWPIFILYFALFFYIVLRAFNLSFTHDESLSYAILFDNPMALQTANNHVLNTILMWISSLFFGSSEIALRLPNILSFGLYLYACFILFKESRNFWLMLLGSSLLLFNPFLIDFFSLARGYGISLGCMMMSLYYLLRNGFNYKNFQSFIKDYKMSIIFASLAVFANLSMINYLIATIIIFTIQFLIKKKSSSKEFAQPIRKSGILLTIVPVLLGFLMLLFLSLKNQLYIGEKTLLGSLNSIIENSFYFSTYSNWVLECVKFSTIFLFLLGVISIFFKRDFFGKLFILTLLIIFIVIGLILEHYLFRANYPEGRTALVFIPLFGLYIYYFVLHIKQYYFQKISFVIICSVVLTMPLLYHFINNFNLEYTKTWRFDAHTKKTILMIESYAKNNPKKTTISNEWFFEPTLNYYINSKKMNIHPSTRNPLTLNSDFIYKTIDNKIFKDFELIITYNDINTVLLKRRRIYNQIIKPNY